MYSKFFLTLCACAVLGTACKKDEKEEVAAHTSKSSGKYLLETSVKNEDGMSGSSYIQLSDKLEGSINNSQAPAAEQYSSDSAGSEGNHSVDTQGQPSNSSGSQAESNSHSD